jgi:flagellar basal body-associated protein FliL
MQKRNRKIKIILLIVGILILVGGVFFIGKKFGEDKKKSNAPTNNRKSKKELENELKQTKIKLNR